MAAKKPAKKAGRPLKCSVEVENKICTRIAKGESLTSICDSGLAGYSTVCRHLDNSATFREKYARARQLQADFHAESIVDIADEITVEARYNGEDVVLDISSSSVARNRLRVDARKWYASKLAPKKYGDKVEIDQKTEHSGTVDVNLSADESYLRMIGKQ